MLAPFDFVASDVPAELQWLALVLAAVAVPLGLMGALAFPQVLFGAPRIVISNEDRRLGSGRALTIKVINESETRWALRRLVRREDAKDMIASLEIHEDGTGRLVVAPQPIEFLDRPKGQPVTIPASAVGVSAVVVRRRSDDGPILVGTDDDNILSEGQYICTFRLTNGVLGERVSYKFYAGSSVDKLHWRA